MAETTPQTLLEAVRYFADAEVCNEFMKRIKWPDGKVACPNCGGESISPVKNRPLLQCNGTTCKKQFSYKVGTIFEGSPLPLGHWFVAIWSIANCKNGISSHELARALGVTQKTAWFMLHRIRLAMDVTGDEKLEGDVESDETFIGGAAKNMHAGKRAKAIKGRGTVGKTIVQGVLKRGGDIRTFIVPATDGDTLRRNIFRNVSRRSRVFTDALPAYTDLGRAYHHQSVDHARKYVDGEIHTNGVENFWSLLKRSLHGTYVAVAPFHLHRYCIEQAYRFNTRTMSDGARFLKCLANVLGKRLTFRNLCAIGDSGFM